MFADQMNIFDFMRQEMYIDKPIRLIELFAGYGSQALALRYLGADFEHYRVVEFDKYAVDSYNAVHGTDFPVLDVTEINGKDLGITDKSEFTYLLTYLLVSLHRLIGGRPNGRHGGRVRNTVISSLGSEEAA